MRRSCSLVLFSAVALLLAIASAGVGGAMADPPAGAAEAVEVEPQSVEEPEGRVGGEEPAPGYTEAPTAEKPTPEGASGGR